MFRSVVRTFTSLILFVSLTSITSAQTISIGERGPAGGLVCDKDYALCTSALYT